jgi:hypothetical protein
MALHGDVPISPYIMPSVISNPPNDNFECRFCAMCSCSTFKNSSNTLLNRSFFSKKNKKNGHLTVFKTIFLIDFKIFYCFLGKNYLGLIRCMRISSLILSSFWSTFSRRVSSVLRISLFLSSFWCTFSRRVSYFESCFFESVL